MSKAISDITDVFTIITGWSIWDEVDKKKMTKVITEKTPKMHDNRTLEVLSSVACKLMAEWKGNFQRDSALICNFHYLC